MHVTTTLTKLEELPAEEPPEPVKPVLSFLSERELTVNEEVNLIEYKQSVFKRCNLVAL